MSLEFQLIAQILQRIACSMSRGESSGGGQSSLGYLFGSEEKPSKPLPTTAVSSLPPYGIDIDNVVAPPNTQLVVSNNRSQGLHLGNIVTVSFYDYESIGYKFRKTFSLKKDRPSTKVTSVPGGHSSLGYLFGDK